MAKRNLRPITLGLVVGSREFFNAGAGDRNAPTAHRPARKARRRLQHPAGRSDQERRGAVARRRPSLRRAVPRRSRLDRRPGHLPAELRRRNRDYGARQRGEARRPDPAAGEQRRDRQGRRRQPPRRLLRQVLRRQQFLPVRRPVHRHDQPHLRRRRRGIRRRSRPLRARLPRRARPEERAGRFDRRAHRRLPDDAVQREAVAGLGPDGGHRRPLRDHRLPRKRCATTRRR